MNVNMSDPKSARRTTFRWRSAAILLIAAGVVRVTPAGAKDEPALPGRIYVAVPSLRDVMHGLLAVDPNERTFMTVDTAIRTAARVAPGGRKVSYNRRDPQTGQFLSYIHDLDQDCDPILVDERSGVLTWSGDGKEVIFSLGVRDDDLTKPRSWRLRPDGSERKPLAVPSTEFVWDWSRDGQWLLAFSARRGGDNPTPPAHLALPVGVMRIDGTEAKEIVPPGVFAKADAVEAKSILTLDPRLSPDGKRVCYIRATFEGNVAQPDKHESQLWIVDRDGQNRWIVLKGTDEEGHPQSAAWAPDGRTLAVVLAQPQDGRRRGMGTIPHLIVVDADGTNRREIPVPPLSVMSIAEWR